MRHEGIELVGRVVSKFTARYSTRDKEWKGIRIPRTLVGFWLIARDVKNRILHPDLKKQNPEARELVFVASLLIMVLLYIATVTFGVHDRVVLVAAAGAIGTVVLGLLTYLSMVEIRKTRREETRPLIVAFSCRATPSDMDPQAFNLDVKVSNSGRWPAVDIMIESEPEFPAEVYGDWGPKEIVHVVSVLPPGQECLIARLNRLSLATWWKPGQQHRIRVRYTDPLGRTYTDTFSLDFEYIVKAGW